MNDDLPRLSAIEARILGLLAGGREMYGLEMVGFDDKLKRGTIYVTLARMQEKGFVESRREEVSADQVIPRRLYRIVALGERALSARHAGEKAMRAVYAVA
jgi:DNA-binding PadR family transcriptional regulator